MRVIFNFLEITHVATCDYKKTKQNKTKQNNECLKHWSTFRDTV